VSVDALPAIFPVFTTVVDDESLAFQTVPGTKLWAATRETIVAVEADAFDHETGAGWSVVVRGRATEITDHEQIAQVQRTQTWSWIGCAAAEHFVQVSLDLVTGRSVGPGN
jgi:nitroimidazol reductase NimA-like FMN-containing flavoprotein (pyridoxamine 5'-phosphate oxidase superfamily)